MNAIAPAAATATGTPSQAAPYDALFAITQSKLNLFLYHAWAANLPETPYLSTGFGGIYDQLNAYALNLDFDTPYLQFQTAGTPDVLFNLPVGMGSWLLNVNLAGDATGGPQLQSAVMLEPGNSLITGTFALAAAQGANVFGSVLLDLGTSQSWSTQIEGIAAGSPALTSIADAVQGYFEAADIILDLGSLQTNQLSPYLVPTAFSLAGFPGTDGDGTILFQVTTTTRPVPTAPVATVPVIPAGSDVTIVVNGANVAAALEQSAAGGIPAEGWTLNTSGSTWVLTPGGSTAIPVGSAIHQQGVYINTFSAAAGSYDMAPVAIPVSTLSLSPAGGNLVLTCNGPWNQPWYTSDSADAQYGIVTSRGPVDFTANQVQITFVPTLTGTNSDCTFTPGGTPTGSIDAQATGNLSFLQPPGPDVMSNLNQTAVTTLQGLAIPGVNEFAIQSLVLPGGNQVTTNAVSLPWDLVSSGSIVPEIAISCPDPLVGPGQSTTLTASQAVTSWRVLGPSNGKLTGSADGTSATYTAPPQVVADHNVVIEAIAGQTTGYFVLGLSTNRTGTMSISPATVVVPVGSAATFSVSGATGTPTVTSSQGRVVQAGDLYNLVGITTPGPITLTVSCGSETVTTVWQAVALDLSMTVTPADPQPLTSGQTLQLSASSDLGTPVYWSLIASSGLPGLISTSGPTSEPVTFTAPTVSEQVSVWAIATSFNPDPGTGTPTQVALGGATLTINPAG
jgi:hypothetical protein